MQTPFDNQFPVSLSRTNKMNTTQRSSVESLLQCSTYRISRMSHFWWATCGSSAVYRWISYFLVFRIRMMNVYIPTGIEHEQEQGHITTAHIRYVFRSDWGTYSVRHISSQCSVSHWNVKRYAEAVIIHLYTNRPWMNGIHAHICTHTCKLAYVRTKNENPNNQRMYHHWRTASRLSLMSKQHEMLSKGIYTSTCVRRINWIEWRRRRDELAGRVMAGRWMNVWIIA